MAVAFGRGCGFASGRSWGNWTPDGILQLEGEANISLSWAHEAHPALNRLMMQTESLSDSEERGRSGAATSVS